MSALLREIRLAVRGLLKARGFTTIALLALSLSVGANTAMFSITRAVLLRPLPYPNPDALVKVQTVLLESGIPIVSAPPDFYAVRAGQRSFTQVGAWYERPVVLTGRDQPERLRAGFLSAELLPLLGVSPVLGRGFDRDDEVWGAHRKVILSDALWHARFGGDPEVLGRTLSLNGEPHLVVGVLPSAFAWLDGEAQLFLPMAFEPGDNLNSHNNYFLKAVGRLRPGVTVEQARRELQGFGERIRAEFPATRSFGLDGTPLLEATVASVRPAVLVYGVIAVSVVQRTREIGIRLAVGALPRTVLRLFLGRGCVLAGIGLSLGLVGAVVASQLARSLLFAVSPTDPLVFGGTALILGATALLASWLPARRAARVDPMVTLREG